MARNRFKPNRRAPSFKPRRHDIRRWLLVVPLLLMAGALLDPSLIGPVGPLAAPPERVSAKFTRCGAGRGPACVVDGDTFRLGERVIRIIGIDAPELAAPKCPAEAALAERAAERLRELLSEGEFELIAHRLQQLDRHGRELMAVRSGDRSIGSRMIDEGLAHRYIGSRRSWC